MKKSLSELCPKELKTTHTNINSGLITNCKTAIKKQIQDLDAEDLRLLLGQNIALKFTVPLALSILKENPLASGDLYKGDLLFSLINISEDFWINNSELNNSLVEIKLEIEELAETLSNQILPKIGSFDYI